MIRFSVLFWISLVGAAAGVLFQVSYSVLALESELASVSRSIRSEEEAIRVLNAEWAYLNQPDRLETLAAQLSELSPLQPDQLIAAAQLIPEPLPVPSVTFASVQGVPGITLLPIPPRRPIQGDGTPVQVVEAPDPIAALLASFIPAAAVGGQ